MTTTPENVGIDDVVYFLMKSKTYTQNSEATLKSLLQARTILNSVIIKHKEKFYLK